MADAEKCPPKTTPIRFVRVTRLKALKSSGSRVNFHSLPPHRAMQKQMSERDEELETVRKELQSMKVPWESEKGKNSLLRRMSVSKKLGGFF